MTQPSWLLRLTLRMVPRRWRESVAQDLHEEAARAGRRDRDAGVWAAARAVGIASWIARQSMLDWYHHRSRWRQITSNLAIDLRTSVRAIVRQPWSAAAVVGTLALGMSAATAAYAVFNHVLFRPVPGVGEPDGLATVYFQPADRHPTYKSAPRAALDALRAAGAFEVLGASDDAQLPIVGRPGSDAELLRVEFVTDQYFEALRVRARAGRLLTADDVTNRRTVALISERWWRGNFNSDRSVIGQSITINRQPVPVVGIVADYRGWGALPIGSVDVWMPIDTLIGEAAVSPDHVFNVVGRLRPGITVAMAEEQLRAPFAPFASSMRTVMSRGSMSTAPAVPIVYPGLHAAEAEMTRDSIARVYPFALGASALLLLVACANTANLLLARTMRRRQDFVMRSALGASRWRLARGLLVEAAALVSIATVAALLLARGFVAAAQGQQLFIGAPALDAVTIDWRVLAFASVVGAGTVVLFGLIPALAASRHALARTLGHSDRTTRAGRRVRAGLICAQLALAVTLLAGAGVLLRSLQNLRGVDLGMNPDGVVSFGVHPRLLGATTERANGFVREMMQRLHRLPGVESVAFASPSPFWRGYIPVTLKTQPTDEVPEHPVSTSFVVSDDFFRTLQIPLLAGRGFTDAEFQRRRPAEGVGIISDSLARQLFGAASAVGRRVYLSQSARGWQLDRTVEIVGVAGDIRSGTNLRGSGGAVLYEPAGPNRGLSVFFVRSSARPVDVLAGVRAAMREAEPNVPISQAGTLRDEVDRLIPEERMLALLIGGVALIATILGVAGVHAVVAHTVVERTREFGIRLAIGASRRAVWFDVLRDVAVLGVIGLGGGLALFAGASRLLESRVYGVSAMDPVTLASVAAVLGVAALAGGWLPARRATLVDPVAALRAQ